MSSMPSIGSPGSREVEVVDVAVCRVEEIEDVERDTSDDVSLYPAVRLTRLVAFDRMELSSTSGRGPK